MIKSLQHQFRCSSTGEVQANNLHNIHSAVLPSQTFHGSCEILLPAICKTCMALYRLSQVYDGFLITALHPTRHKTDYFGDALPSQSLCWYWEQYMTAIFHISYSVLSSSCFILIMYNQCCFRVNTGRHPQFLIRYHYGKLQAWYLIE